MSTTEKRVGHTPGPWVAITGWTDAAEVVDSQGYEVAEINYTAINRNWLDDNPNLHWARGGKASHIERDIEELDANARLIAAAPTQYAALLDALAWYMHHVYDGAPDAENPDWVDDAREALADALVGDKDARTRWEAVERALADWGAE